MLTRSRRLTAAPREKPDSDGLVRAAQAGDEVAFASLVRVYQDIAVAYATAMLGDYHLAEDAAQEAFVDAYRELKALRSPAAFAGWLRTIVAKHCDRITRRKRHPTTGLEAALEVASAEPSPHDLVELHETRAAVRAAIAALPDIEREAVLLFYMGDQSHAETAAFLGITSNAVKTRLYSARQRLRRQMGEIEKGLDEARPSRDDRFAAKVRRMIQPEALKQQKPWMWSTGIGTDVWAMFCACLTGDLETVAVLLRKDPSLVRAHYEYRTPLTFAVRENHIDVVRYLLDHGADPLMYGELLEVARERGFGPLAALLEERLAALGATSRGERVAAAIRERDIARVRALLDAEPDLLHAGDGRSNQPIHWAVMTRQLPIIDELLARGADINARRQDGARPIYLTNGDYFYRGWRDVPMVVLTTPDEVYRHLVARGADVDMGMAAAKGNLKRVRELIERDPSLANRVSDYNAGYVGSGAPLKNAAITGHLDIVRLLLEHGADPNLPEEGIAPHGHALYSAVTSGHYEIAKLLLEHGAFPNPPVESSADAVSIATMNGDRRMLELLGSYGAMWEIDMGRRTKLSYKEIVATGVRVSPKILGVYGDVATAESMFATDPSLADDPEALGNAAGHGHEAFVRLMLQHQPDLAKRVTVSRPREMAELLFTHGMDPNRPNWLRKTPLHDFAQRGDVEGAALFLDHGADIEARDEERCWTPLAWAAAEGGIRMVEFLIRRGARVDDPDGPPWAKPVAVAMRRGHDAIVRLLTDYENTGTLPSRARIMYDALAADLPDAFGGSREALRRVIDALRGAP